MIRRLRTTALPRTSRLLPCCALQVSRVNAAPIYVAGHVTGAAGVVNAEDLKRFASYFWNEGSDLIDKDEATRCLRAFLQVEYP